MPRGTILETMLVVQIGTQSDFCRIGPSEQRCHPATALATSASQLCEKSKSIATRSVAFSSSRGARTSDGV